MRDIEVKPRDPKQGPNGDAPIRTSSRRRRTKWHFEIEVTVAPIPPESPTMKALLELLFPLATGSVIGA